MIVQTYGESFLSIQTFGYWFREFRTSGFDVRDKESSAKAKQFKLEAQSLNLREHGVGLYLNVLNN